MSCLYIHIPFCLSTCSYCSFNSFAGLESLYDRYVQALKKEAVAISFSREVPVLSTLFLGGGTPTVLSADQIEVIVGFCGEYFGFQEGAEISIEANPKTVDFVKLLSLQQLGINRISIGVQSFVDQELQRLGRLHGAQDGWNAVEDAKSVGLNNLSLDLMSGIPGQTPESWQWSLETALSLEPQHLSLYQLSVEEGTDFERQMSGGKLFLPTEDDIIAMDLMTERLCSEAGFEQYEISNYSKPGHECRHNINYWENRDYLSLGAGAVSYSEGDRRKTIGDPLEYCKRIEEEQNAIAESEQLDRHKSFKETVVMGLRMNRGVSLEDAYKRYGIRVEDYYGGVLENLIKKGFLMLTDTHLCLTRKGRPVANMVMAELV